MDKNSPTNTESTPQDAPAPGSAVEDTWQPPVDAQDTWQPPPDKEYVSIAKPKPTHTPPGHAFAHTTSNLPSNLPEKAKRFADKMDFDLFERLCAMQCTPEEVRFALAVRKDFLEEAVQARYNMDFDKAMRKYANAGRIALRRAQWRVAVKGDVQMLKWLGQQWLGQATRVSSRIEATIDTTHTHVHALSDADLVKVIQGATVDATDALLEPTTGGEHKDEK